MVQGQKDKGKSMSEDYVTFQQK